jgi:anti-sigma factor RsiW
MSGELEIADVELHAFIDGALDAERFHVLEARIAADPELAERIAAFRSDKDLLKRVYAPLIDRPIPREWLALVHSSGARTWPAISWRLVGSLAAAVTLIAIGALAYWALRSPDAGEVVQAALDARTNAMRAQQVITVPANADIARYGTVLSTAVALNVKVPDLKRMGYRLTGILLYPRSPKGNAAELLYRDDKDRSFTLYLRRSDGKARFDQFERGGLRICVWQDEVLSTVMAGDVSTAAMQRLASLAYTGLTL